MNRVSAFLMIQLVSWSCRQSEPAVPEPLPATGGGGADAEIPVDTGETPVDTGGMNPMDPSIPADQGGTPTPPDIAMPVEPAPMDPKPMDPDPMIPMDPKPMDPGETPCAANTEVTVSKALAPNFKTTGEAQSLKYELQLLDCKGKALPIKNQILAFDIGVPVFTGSWTYEILDGTGSTSLVSATFNKKSGHNIFGPKSNYYLLETKALGLSTEQLKVVFVVKIGSFTSNASYPEEIKTYQKIGSTKPVTNPLKPVD